MEDKSKINDITKKLNSGLKNQVWFPVDGFKILPNISYKPGRKDITVTPNSGYPVKLFVNLRTGEVKAYVAILFEVDEDGKT